MAPSKGILLIILIFPSLFHLCLSDGAVGGTGSDSLNQFLDTGAGAAVAGAAGAADAATGAVAGAANAATGAANTATGAAAGAATDVAAGAANAATGAATGAAQAVDTEKQNLSSSTKMTSLYGLVTMLIVLVFSAY